MHLQHYKIILAFSLSCTSLFSAALPGPQKRSTTQYPYTKLVAFGDQYSDNGNGSYAHGLDPGNIYNYYTWTDGPVCPTYLAGLLNVPLVDYAWGGWFGGGLAGSTLDNAYTPAKDFWNGSEVPSVQDQIFANYTANGAPQDISTSLQFIWAGQNDLKKHTDWFAAKPSQITPTAKLNQFFYGNLTYYLRTQAEHLIQLGAPAVIVVNLLHGSPDFFWRRKLTFARPLQASPEANQFFCHGNQICLKNWGTVIQAANTHLQAGLKASQYANQIIYYDLFSFMTMVMANKNSYGYTQPLTDFCDGNSSVKGWSWPKCTVNKWSSARPYFWFTNDQPETSMHNFIAQDILKTIDAYLALS